MRKTISSKHLENVSDLTLWAPIKLGFVPALEAVTYETRARLVMKALFNVRSTAREHAKFQPFVESAERIQSLLDFRIAVLDQEEWVPLPPPADGDPRRAPRPKMLMLSVAFDRPFEPYMRLVWDPLGPLLDLFFCNTEKYVVAAESSFPEYLEWVRRSQIDTDFFYASSNHTIVDVQYLSQIERLHRAALLPNLDVIAMSETATDPVDRAKEAQKRNPVETMDLGLQALVALGRLTDYYPPDDESEGGFLKRAAAKLLQDWDPGRLPPQARFKYADYLELLNSPGTPAAAPEPEYADPTKVQAGILRGYEGAAGEPMTHGCLMLMRVRDVDKARAWLAALIPSTEADPYPAEDGITLNVAFTYGGLKTLGVRREDLEKLPQEFREGMEARAGMIGDTGDAHPRRWTLPRRCRADPDGEAPPAPIEAPPVELCEVDLVLQLRTNSNYRGHDVLGDPAHPLAARVAALAAASDRTGVELLGMESMRRAWLEDGSHAAVAKDHFGFLDGFSQPVPPPNEHVPERDRVSLGELLIGYANDRGDPPPQTASELWSDGSFLVIRKLKQEVAELNEFLTRSVQDLTNAGFPTKNLRENLLGKMMGRLPDGAPMLDGASAASNDFDYKSDLRGQFCPFQSHIRRANPRTERSENFNRPVPRIMRRGMSYGPPGDAGADGDRGVMFMAYNSSIAEQFEVVQSWISGGNSTRVASCQSDPLMGPARDQDDRTFAFRLHDKTARLRPQPYVKLQWGTYLFAPSIAGLRAIARPHRPDTDDAVAKGLEFIGRIEALQPVPQAIAWKACFEDVGARDPDEGNVGPQVWAAIRAGPGAKKVPYGDPNVSRRLEHAVLVGRRDLIDRVLADDETFTVEGYRDRMENSIGFIYLGRDAGPDYWAESQAANDAVYKVTSEDAFEDTRQAATRYLEGFRKTYAATFPEMRGPVKIDLANDYIAGVLALVCRKYFELPDQPPGAPPSPEHDIWEGPWRWAGFDRRNPVCPGDFIAPSSYIFYLDPIAGFIRRGQRDGKALRAAAAIHYEKRLRADPPNVPHAPIAAAVFKAFRDRDDAADMIARTMIGIMMGFLPPAEGCLKGTLYEWLKHGTLWRIQHELLALDPAARGSYGAVSEVLRKPLVEAIKKRPAPDALWRTATKATTLGEAKVEPGDKIYLGIASATAEAVGTGYDAIYPVFGGDRSAANHPTHACPAFKFAMGVLTGALCALLEVGRIENLPAPLIVTIPRLPGT